MPGALCPGDALAVHVGPGQREVSPARGARIPTSEPPPGCRAHGVAPAVLCPKWLWLGVNIPGICATDVTRGPRAVAARRRLCPGDTLVVGHWVRGSSSGPVFYSNPPARGSVRPSATYTRPGTRAFGGPGAACCTRARGPRAAAGGGEGGLACRCHVPIVRSQLCGPNCPHHPPTHPPSHGHHLALHLFGRYGAFDQRAIGAARRHRLSCVTEQALCGVGVLAPCMGEFASQMPGC
jgi:hypothetical protein